MIQFKIKLHSTMALSLSPGDRCRLPESDKTFLRTDTPNFGLVQLVSLADGSIHNVPTTSFVQPGLDGAIPKSINLSSVKPGGFYIHARWFTNSVSAIAPDYKLTGDGNKDVMLATNEKYTPVGADAPMGVRTVTLRTGSLGWDRFDCPVYEVEPL